MSLITTIEDLRKLAQKRVPRMFYDYADSGSWTESTYRANESDFARIQFRQRVARNIDERSIRASMIGQDMAMPVALAPTGLAGMQHADGEILTARAAARFGLRYTLLSIAGVILGGGEFTGGRVSPVGAVLVRFIGSTVQVH